MNPAAEKYIIENRFSKSMVDMAKQISIPYNKVRDYMIANNLALTKQQIHKIKAIKRNTPKNWDHDALF